MADAASAISAAARTATARCNTPGGPTGVGKVKVTFDPGTGQVVIAEIVGPPFKHTSVGECVVRTFLSMKIAPFDGSPVFTTKSFHIE